MITYEYRLPSDINYFRRSVGWYEFSKRQIDCVRANSLCALTALDGDKEVASARLVGDGGYQFFISDVIVIPEYQRRGIGREMLNMLFDFALSKAEDGETIMLNLMSAKDKEPFYEKLGFMRRPNEIRGSGMTRFLTKGEKQSD